MSAAVIETTMGEGLPALVSRAALALAGATSAAEVLEARDAASFAYDMAKKAARLAEAKGASDTVVAAAHRAQGDALIIEGKAKHLYAAELEKAQIAGEVRSNGETTFSHPEKLGFDQINAMPPRQLYEARQIKAAEERDPGIIERTVEAALEAGEEPTRALVKRAITGVDYLNERGSADVKAIEDAKDFRNLRKLWNASSSAVKQQFRDYIAKG